MPKTKTKTTYVNIYGPAATGKTTNRDLLAEHYGCGRVIDDCYEMPPALVPDPKRILLISNEPIIRRPNERPCALTYVEYVTVEQARVALGDKWRVA